MTTVTSILIGDSLPMRRLREMITRLAPTRVPVLIEGETGTGKELVAELLHRQSGRTGSFVAFNICALSDAMFEAAIFGHTKGAFTGAVGDTLGFLREANGGSAFLDEISGLPLALQPKLLRAVETGVFRPLGSSRDVAIDFRVIAATNECIDELVDAGRFRADLAHRLRGLVLSVPSLAERTDDIPALVDHFARRAREPRPVGVAHKSLELLQGRHWPGNIRELKQVVEAALVFSGDVLDADSIQFVLAQRSKQGDAFVPKPIVVERQRLLKLLMSTEWDTEEAALTLGVHRTTVYRRMRRLGIPVPSTNSMTLGDRSPDVVEASIAFPKTMAGSSDLRANDGRRASSAS